MKTAFSLALSFSSITCYKCKLTFAVPMPVKQDWLETGKTFYCPQGHDQLYTETEIHRLQKEIAQEKKRREWAEASRESAYHEIDSYRRKSAALKGVITKTKKRIGNGICPCCNRTFLNLQRHMSHKHPDFSSKKDE